MLVATVRGATAAEATERVINAKEAMDFTLYSRPVELRYGEVHNKIQWNEQDPMRLPEDVVRRFLIPLRIDPKTLLGTLPPLQC